MKRSLLIILGALVGPCGAFADPAFLEKASGLLSEGRTAEAAALARTALEANPNDADALVIAGTAVLYDQVAPRYDDSIYHTSTDPSADADLALTPAAAAAVASYWKRIPALDPTRTYLWGDLAQMTFRSGNAAGALEFALPVLADPSADADALQAAASVFVLNLDWARAAQALERLPGNRTALLYRGLDSWRTGKEGWREALKAFADNPGSDPAGSQTAAYLAGPQMRDTESGYLEALKVEGGIAALAVKQKYVDRYPDRFLARLDLARSLSVYGSFDKALFHFSEIDRKGLASNADERQTVLFQEAWAYQGAGRTAEAAKLWGLLTEARDFYVRSAAAWFLGHQAVREGKTLVAKELWTAHPPTPPRTKSKDPEPEIMPSVIEEASRSKYAFWAAQEFRTLK